jgi:polar amino acid transport system ATP-binding protein
MTAIDQNLPIQQCGGVQYQIVRPLVKIENVRYSVHSKGQRKLLLRDIGTEAQPFLINDLAHADAHNQGHIIAVLGRSGGGKSTLFRLLSGMSAPTMGSIVIPKHSRRHGKAVDEFDHLVPVTEGTVGLVQQDYPLSRNQTVYSMLMEAAKMGGIPSDKRVAEVDESLKEWGIYDQRDQSANQLSGGQKQRVAIIEQILCSHHFIILDEPFSGLDVKNTAALKSTFKKIIDTDEFNTIFFSTHIIELAVELADHIYVIGYEYDEKGKQLPGGTIIAQYDLKKMGMAWQPYDERHMKLKTEIENLIIEN